MFHKVGDRGGAAAALRGLGLIAAFDGTGAKELQEASLALAQEAGDLRGMAAALFDMGGRLWRGGNVPAARALYGKSLTLSEAVGDQRQVAFTMLMLGNLAFEEPDYSAARARYEAARMIFERTGNSEGLAIGI